MKKIISIIFTLAFLSISFSSLTNGNGPGGGYTNANGESVCSNSSCHGGTLNAGGSLSNLKMDNNFTGGGYIPDSTYTLKVKMSQSGISKWGFCVTALYGSSDLPAGDFTNTSTRTQKRTKSISGKTRQYIEHTSGGTSSTTTNATDWEFQWKAPSSNVGNITFYVALNAANGNGSTSGDQIYAQTFVFGPSTLLSKAKITSSDTLICSGKTAKFNGSGTNTPTSYSWVFPNGSPSISTDQNPTVNYNAPGNYRAILRVMNAKGWSEPDTLNIKVLQSPTAFISGNAVRKICKGESVKLTAQFTPGNNYLWSNSKTGNEITVTDTGTYYVFVSSSTCQSISNAVEVRYFDEVKVDLESTYKQDSICSGELVIFSSTAVQDSFFWYRGSKLLGSTDTNFIKLNIDSSGFYAVRAKDANGCIGPFSDSIQYKVRAKENPPVVTCQNQGPFNVDFDWTGSLSHGIAQISLNKGATWLTPSTGSTGNYHSLTNLNPETDYEVWVRGAIPAPCFYTNPTKKICRTGKCSPIEAVVIADSMICEGEELTVEINGLSNERYSLSFEGGNAFTDTIFNFSPIIEKSYVIEILDSNNLGCPTKKLNFPVYIDNISQLRFETQKTSNTFCSGDTVIFTATSGNDNYNFYVNSKLRYTTSDSFYYESKFSDGDTAFVQVQKGACTETSQFVLLNVVPVPDASFTFSNVGSQYTFEPDVLSYKSYFWDFGDGFTSVVKSPLHSYLNSSNQTVLVNLNVVDNSTCRSSSNQSINLPDFSSIDLLNNSEIKIYPIPTTNYVNVEWLGEDFSTAQIIVSDLKGLVLFDSPITEREVQIDLSSYQAGMYILTIKTKDGSITKRLFKQ